jgi:hypothetical protein
MLSSAQFGAIVQAIRDRLDKEAFL